MSCMDDKDLMKLIEFKKYPLHCTSHSDDEDKRGLYWEFLRDFKMKYDRKVRINWELERKSSGLGSQGVENWRLKDE